MGPGAEPAGRTPAAANGEVMPAGVAVVIVNHNGLVHLQRCLRALRPTLRPRTEVVVVDNGSSDGSVAWLAADAPWARVIALESNVGFGAANRAGIKATSAPLLALLNNDTEPQPGWLEALAAPLAADPAIAASCAQLRLMADPRTLNAHGGGMSRLGFGFDHYLHMPLAALPAGPAWTDCLFPTAAAALIRREALLGIGGFDPAFFMYHEDVDLGWRLWLAGWRVVVCRDAVVLHARGGSSPVWRGTTFRDRLGARHAARSLLKNYGPRLAAVKSVRLARTWLRERQIGLLLQVGWWNLVNLPSTLKERRRVQRGRRVTDEALFEAGLIDEAPMPPPFPVPAHDTGRSTADFAERGTLEPASTSGVGRLGPGWYARERHGAGWQRVTCGTALCRLRVAAGATGALRVSARQEFPPRARVAVHANGSFGESETGNDGCVEVSVPTTARDDGMIEVEIRSPGSVPHGVLKNWNFRRTGCAVDRIEFVPDGPAGVAPPQRISVVIPTYNRSGHLGLVLDALARQTRPAHEVIVVDDGSTDDTWALLQRWQAGPGAAERRLALHQENSRPGRARNNGVAHATGDLVIFLGDDTLPDPDFIAAHLARHTAAGGPAAVIGYTGWDSSRMRVTPFLQFINAEGPQFAYGLLDESLEVPFNCFYTSNVSLRRELLGEAPFDPRLDFVGWEDVELGYRLNLAGVPLLYEPRARVRHVHPTTVRSFWRRQYGVGATFPVLCDVQPRLLEEGLLPQPLVPARFRPLIPLFAAALPLLSLLDRLQLRLSSRAYHTLVNCAFFSGLGGALRARKAGSA